MPAAPRPLGGRYATDFEAAAVDPLIAGGEDVVLFSTQAVFVVLRNYGCWARVALVQ